jgi:hypothetical protein
MKFWVIYSILFIPFLSLNIAIYAMEGSQIGLFGVAMVAILNIIPTKLVLWISENGRLLATKSYRHYFQRQKSERFDDAIMKAHDLIAQGHYQKGLRIIQNLLEQDATNSEALQLKTQILSKGFNDQGRHKGADRQKYAGKRKPERLVELGHENARGA